MATSWLVRFQWCDECTDSIRFSFGEFTETIYRCRPPASRCLGGRMSPCALGYVGDFCLRCDDEYYQRNYECVHCETTGGTAALLLVLVCFACIIPECFSCLSRL